MASQKTRSVVRIKKGERVILPADAQIISVTEVDGASAESLCDLPAPTPLKEYIFFFDRRADGPTYGHYIGIQSFHLGQNKVTWEGRVPHNDEDLSNEVAKAIKAVPGVAIIYACNVECNSSDGCSNILRISIPESMDAPYFTCFMDDNVMDNWIFRLDPVDLDNPLQTNRDFTCNNRV